MNKGFNFKMDKAELKVIILLLGILLSIGFGCIIGKYFFADNDKLSHASDLSIKSKQVVLDEMVKEYELREKEKAAYFKYSNERINNYASNGKNEAVFFRILLSISSYIS